MKYIIPILALVLFLSSSSCEQASKGTTIKGELAGASDLQVYFDQVEFGEKSTIIGKAQAGSDGAFSINFPEGLAEGLYRLKVGRQEMDLVFDGTEKVVKVTGNVEKMKEYQIDLEGSGPSETLVNTIKAIQAKEFKSLDDINKFVDTTSNAYVGAIVVMKSVPMRADLLASHKNVLNKLALQYPGTPMTTNYEQYVAQMEQALMAKQVAEKIKVGQMAPEIKLESPDGKTYALSDLKGKVVMLDFWASWCGPCRRANPSVVALYDKYKDQGFTIFSVSLDGPRRTQGLSAEQLQEQFDRSRQKWVAAIEKDNLTWPYHVSDLQGWGAAPAKEYGVSSIPKTFLLDKEGKIVKTGVNPLSGIGQLEKDVKALL